LLDEEEEELDELEDDDEDEDDDDAEIYFPCKLDFLIWDFPNLDLFNLCLNVPLLW